MSALGFLGWVPFALLGCGRLGFDSPVDALAGDVQVDDAPDATLPLCERVTGELYCSDFEGGGLGGAGNGGAQYIAGAGWNGSDGFRMTAAPGQTPNLAFTLPSPVTTGELHIGGRLFLAPGPPSADFVVVAQVISPAFEKASLDFTNFDRVQLVNNVGSGGTMGPDGGFPRGRWACFELVVVVAPVNGGGRVEALIDEVSALARVQNTATAPSTGFTRVEIGAVSSSSNTATEVIMFDNWIVSTQPIGCP